MRKEQIRRREADPAGSHRLFLLLFFLCGAFLLRCWPPMRELLGAAKGKPEFEAFENLALRSMAKAVYSTDNIGHYGLAFPFYTHFTSPIRRFPDLMVHRLLSIYLRGGDSADKSRQRHRRRVFGN